MSSHNCLTWARKPTVSRGRPFVVELGKAGRVCSIFRLQLNVWTGTKEVYADYLCEIVCARCKAQPGSSRSSDSPAKRILGQAVLRDVWAHDDAPVILVLEEETDQFAVAIGGKKGKENPSAAPVSDVGLVRCFGPPCISSAVACPIELGIG